MSDSADEQPAPDWGSFKPTRLPPELRDQIIRELPPPEVRARMYQELREQGGLSIDDLLDTTDSFGQSDLPDRARHDAD